MKRYSSIPLIAGLLFGAGMVISDMVNPIKVIAFLDVAGAWKVDLAFVMGGALLVFAPMYHLVIKPRQRPLDQTEFCITKSNAVDRKLIFGASLFGLGWGIAGICPGPALASLSTLNFGLISFIAAMVVGMELANKLQSKFELASTTNT
ncbi:YeeE/YedE family protein [Vibrio algivorus]|uniref:Transporter n=1 Tax=Vibrio algivorus TaxID=1667024 RepID=A0ABQ6ENK2_9VIBR|nr:YeeE/YedE family protein [Vibrio algivorus]GLT14564.1 transporter [Vibrio algivorus]